ncbi:MAG: aspartate/glutamate racemase family protein [Bacillota bacterium]|nr:aspartate/glutamate racemase family protein [Bacillota bacterium]
MKTIGLLGGMSWESSLEYYRIINEEVRKRLGKSHSAKCLLYSFDFFEIEKLQNENRWDELEQILIKNALNLKNAGAEFLVICANTTHLYAQVIEEKAGIKVVHIADAVGKEIKQKGLSKVALLGTKYTMESEFYKNILKEKYNIDIIIPNIDKREIIHRIVYEELVKGILSEESKEKYVDIINGIDAEGVILGCTEIPLLIKQEDVSMPVFDTTAIHAIEAVDYALDDN